MLFNSHAEMWLTEPHRFSPDSGTSHSPVYSIEPNIHNPNSSSQLAYLPYTNIYHQPSLNGSSSYSNGSSSYFSPPSSIFSLSDIKPRLNSLYDTSFCIMVHYRSLCSG